MTSSTRPSQPTLATLAKGATRFLRWWSTELATWVPAPLRLWWCQAGNLVLVSVDNGKVVFSRPAGNRLEELHKVELDERNTSLDRSSVAQALRKAVGGDSRLVLSLPSQEVLRLSLSLPLSVEENLRQTMAFELDRYTPFKPSQAYFDYRISARETQRNRMTVNLAVVPRSAVDNALQQLTTIGLSVAGATLADDVLTYRGNHRDFLPATIQRPRGPIARHWWRLTLALLAIVLALAVIIIPLWQKRSAVIVLLEPLAQAKQAAQQTDAKRDQLTKLVEERNLLPEKKWQSHSAVRLLEELTKRLPDDTFLIHLEVDGRTVQIQGESASSANLIEALEASPLFKDVAFKAQLTKIQGTGFDRFHVSAALEANERDLQREAGGAESATAPAAPSPMTATPSSPATEAGRKP